MFFLLRLCLGLVVLVPSLAHAQLTSALGIPGHGTTVSGIGVISGWKCEAEGDITIRLNDGDPIPATYGLPRTDTIGVCDNDGNNGFFSYTNWGNLGDGQHTVVVYDDGNEFARSTFTVTTPGTYFLKGASKEIMVEDFPNPGDSMVLEWNEGTQHFEIVDFMGSGDLGECMEGLTVRPGAMCSGSIKLGEQEVSYIFSVNVDGQGCVDLDIGIDLDCFDTSEEFESLLSTFGVSGPALTKNDDDSWTIDSIPADL